MTLIELLAAIAILAAVSVAASSWTVSAARTSASVTRQLTWERAANAALDTIARDVLTGDFRNNTDNIEVDDNHLRIIARVAGPVENEYTLDGFHLVRRTFRVDSRGRRTGTKSDPARALVGGVSAWAAVLIEDDEGNVTVLSLTLAGYGDQNIARRISLP